MDTKETNIDPAILIMTILLVGSVLLAFYQKGVVKKLPHGVYTMDVPLQEKDSSLQMGKLVVNPLDPTMGAEQRITVAVKSTTPVKKVSALVKTDNKVSAEHELLPGDGTSLESNWTGYWMMNDTYGKTYEIILRAENAKETVEITVPLSK